MGRYSTGAVCTTEVMQLRLSYLLKSGCIKQGNHTKGTISWQNGCNIEFECNLSGDEGYIRLMYQHTHSYTGEVKNMDYQFYLDGFPSNLGRGEVLYFSCPSTYKWCRVLYLCNATGKFQSRFSFRNRLYYPCQTSSKSHYHLDRCHGVEKQLEQLYSQVVKSHYKGSKTALQRRIEALEKKYEYYNVKSLEVFERMLGKYAKNIDFLS